MADIRDGAPVTLQQIHDELKTMGFGDPDQDINGGDFVEYGGQLFEDITKALAEQPEVKPIRITMEGGLIQYIDNIPAGTKIEVWDFDTEGMDIEDMKKNEAGEEYFLTVWP